MPPTTTPDVNRLLPPALLLASLAHASTPDKVVHCTTTASRKTGVSDATIRQKCDDNQSSKVIFKVSHSNCDGFDAIANDGSMVEACDDSVSAQLGGFNKAAPDDGFKGASAATIAAHSARLVHDDGHKLLKG